MAGDTPHDASAPSPASHTPDTATPVAGPRSHAPGDPHAHGPKGHGLGALTLGAIGVVFGDIGTSPLYAMREALHHSRSGGTAELAVLGVVSLVF